MAQGKASTWDQPRKGDGGGLGVIFYYFYSNMLAPKAYCLTAWPPQSLVARPFVGSVCLGQLAERSAEPRPR
eukprot:13610-Alexandrium_andersonii.AAC.1